MNVQAHDELKAKIWEIANRLRGPYRPPQYRLVMLPMVVLRRLDCVLEPTKDSVLKQYGELQARRTPEAPRATRSTMAPLADWPRATRPAKGLSPRPTLAGLGPNGDR